MNRSTTLIRVLEKVIFVRVIFLSESVNLSIGIGAKLVCRYMDVPIPATIKPQPKHKNLKNNRSGVTQVRNNNNQKSIHMPVIKAVTKPKYSGFCFCSNELINIIARAMIISQLPTVKPTFRDKPTSRASNGELPRSDCMVNVMPRVRIKIPIA
jgi:hypothetical protein